MYLCSMCAICIYYDIHVFFECASASLMSLNGVMSMLNGSVLVLNAYKS